MAKELTTFNNYSNNRRTNIRLIGDEPDGQLSLTAQVEGFLDFLAAQGWRDEEVYAVIQDAFE